eukprot:2701413-Amphidinium_carterae.1
MLSYSRDQVSAYHAPPAATATTMQSSPGGSICFGESLGCSRYGITKMQTGHPSHVHGGKQTDASSNSIGLAHVMPLNAIGRCTYGHCCKFCFPHYLSILWIWTFLFVGKLNSARGELPAAAPPPPSRAAIRNGLLWRHATTSPVFQAPSECAGIRDRLPCILCHLQLPGQQYKHGLARAHDVGLVLPSSSPFAVVQLRARSLDMPWRARRSVEWVGASRWLALSVPRTHCAVEKDFWDAGQPVVSGGTGCASLAKAKLHDKDDGLHQQKPRTELVASRATGRV